MLSKIHCITAFFDDGIRNKRTSDKKNCILPIGDSMLVTAKFLRHKRNPSSPRDKAEIAVDGSDHKEAFGCEPTQE